MINLYTSIECKTALSQSKLPGLKYSLNPYFGCEHGCIYCYSRSIFRNRDEALNWGHSVKPKTNIPEILRKELRGKERGVVGVSTVTDPYQPVEAKLQLTRKCLEALSESNFFVSIQTKSSLILRDLDLINPRFFEVGVSISTFRPEIAQVIEPKASIPQDRAKIVEEFSKRGVKTWIFLGPIIPSVNDKPEEFLEIVKLARKTGSYVIYDKLNLRRWVQEAMKPFFHGHNPEIFSKLGAMLKNTSDYWREKASIIEEICSHNGVICEAAFPQMSASMASPKDKSSSTLDEFSAGKG